MASYTIRLATTEADRAAILALWGQAFPAPQQHPVKYDWCYGQTPQGQGRLYVMTAADGAVIGVQGIVPRRWWIRREAVPTGICADLVVDKNHRSIGPALSMVRQVVELEQRSNEVRLLYGFPNPKSEALYRRAGYRKLDVITRYARPLRLQRWLRRKGMPKPLARIFGKLADLAFQLRLLFSTQRNTRNWRCVPVSEFDARFDALWARVAGNAPSMVIRDREYLHWRFGNNFAGQTRVMALVTHAGQIDAYAVYIVADDGMVYVLDFLAADDTQALPALLKLFARAMYRQGRSGIMLEFSGPAAVVACLRDYGFSARETSPIYAVLGHSEIGTHEGSAFYFTSSDRDQ